MLLKRASAAQAASSSHRSACLPPSAAVPAPACRASLPAAAAVAQCAWPAQAVAGPRHAASQREQGGRSRVVVAATAGAAAEELEVIAEERPGQEVVLTVTVPPAVVKRYFNSTVEKLAQQVVGPLRGFRETKQVPLPMIIQQVGGQKNFKGAAVEDLLMSVLEVVVEGRKKGERIMPDSVSIVSRGDELVGGYDPAKPFRFVFRYERVPPIKWKRSYREIAVSVREVGTPASDAAAAEDLIRQYRKERGSTRVVVGRGLARSDVAIIDLAIEEKGAGLGPLPGLSKRKLMFDTEADPMDLTAGMVGMKPGETRTFDLTFPADWHVESLRGMRAEATIKAHELFSWVLPEFDDDFVKRHYPKFSGKEDMRQALASTTMLERMKATQQATQDAILDAIAAQTELEVPEAMLMELGVAEYRSRLMASLQKKELSMEDVERMTEEAQVVAFVDANRGELAERARFLMAADEIFDAEGLALSEEDVALEVAAAVETFERDGLEYDATMVRQNVEEQIKMMKVMQWLSDNVKVEVLPAAG